MSSLNGLGCRRVSLTDTGIQPHRSARQSSHELNCIPDHDLPSCCLYIGESPAAAALTWLMISSRSSAQHSSASARMAYKSPSKCGSTGL